MKVLGLDLGITSVGWGLLDLENDSIVAAGVRTFTAAENPKDGSSLAADRREARSMRRRLRRKRHRLERIRQWMLDAKLVGSEDELEGVLSDTSVEMNPWNLRAEALDRKLSNVELCKALYHLAQRRGFKSNRRTDQGDKETGQLLAGLQKMGQVLETSQYRTYGELMSRDPAFASQKRNRGGQYSHTAARAMIKAEAELLLESQRKFGHVVLDEHVQRSYLDILLSQRSFDQGNVEAMIGNCSLEPEEKRAAKAAYSAELFVAMQQINNLRLESPTGTVPCQPDQRGKILELLHKQKKPSYKAVRKVLQLSDDTRFAGVAKENEVPVQGRKLKIKTEKDPVAQLPAWHEIRSRVKKELGENTAMRLLENREWLDAIGTICTNYKDEAKVVELFRKADIPQQYHDVLVQISFRHHLNLSLKALRRLEPHLAQGMVYSDAVQAAGYTFSRSQNGKANKLPVIEQDDIRNPVVFRAVTQARKVVNAILREYGMPDRIHVETSRELGKPLQERRKDEKQRQDNRNDRNRAIARLAELYPGVASTGGNILKFRLAEEQRYFCVYSGAKLDPHRLFEPGYVEIDHILPFSRSFDNSYMNKVLCLGSENRNKANRTPWEYFGEDQSRWSTFEVRTKDLPYPKRRRCLRKEFTRTVDEDFLARHGSDTRYINRYFVNLLQDNLAIPRAKVLGVKGTVTGYLRTRWTLHKDRDLDSLHHAVDALVVAAATPPMIRQLAHYAENNELYLRDAADSRKLRTIDRTTGEEHISAAIAHQSNRLPQPWGGFADDVHMYVRGGYDSESGRNVPGQVFVSRPPRRKVTGAAHKETIHTPKTNTEGMAWRKIALSDIKPEYLTYLDRPHQQQLRAALQRRLDAAGGDAAKAFANGEPMVVRYKSGAEVPVRSIRIPAKPEPGGVSLVRMPGKAAQDSMVRVDVFTRDGKFYYVPIYVADMVKPELPNRSIAAHKAYLDWPEMDDSYLFLFSLCSDDVVLLQGRRDNEPAYYYYSGIDVSTAALSVFEINLSRKRAKSIRIGGSTLAKLEKWQVDPLGNLGRVRHEPRKGSLRN